MFLHISEFPTHHPLFIALPFDIVCVWFDTMLCEPLLVVFISFMRLLFVCVIFPPFLLVLLYNNSSAYNKSPLTTIHGVVLLLQETEPLFLWKMLFLINNILIISRG